MRSHLFVITVCFGLLAGCGEKQKTAEASDTPPAAAATPADDAKAAPPSSAQPGARGEVTMPTDAPELKEMTIEAVKMRSVPADVVMATARIEVNPRNVAHALSPVPGRVTNLAVHLGDNVMRGQTLATVESTVAQEAESDYLQSMTAIHQAELAAAKADADLERLNDLYEHMAVAQKEVLAARTTQALAKSALEQAQLVRDHASEHLALYGLKAGQKHQQIVVTAPISGRVTEVSVAEGEFRNDINLPLFTVTDLSRVWVTSEVPESKIRLCRIGGFADLELIAFPNEKFRARVTRIADSVNSDTRTIKVNAEIDNKEGRLRPEMFGNVQYAGGEMPAPWVPEAAVVRQNGTEMVFVEHSTGHFQAVPVDLGPPSQGGFPVHKGVQPGDRIVTQGAIYLKAAL